jgi:SAM-dependent methyltransferase
MQKQIGIVKSRRRKILYEISKVRAYLVEVGIAKTLCKCIAAIFGIMGNPEKWRLGRRAKSAAGFYEQKPSGVAWDARLGIETESRISASELDVDVKSIKWAQGNRYEPSSVDAFREMMDALKIDFEQYEFVDLGSGKGRTLILATEYGFRKITGVEYAKNLHDVASRNIEKLKGKIRNWENVVAVHLDATKFAIPNEPVVLYMFNPFSLGPMKTIVRNIVRSVEKKPRDNLFIVYSEPRQKELFNESEYFLKIKYTGDYAIYRCVPPDSSRNC